MNVIGFLGTMEKLFNYQLTNEQRLIYVGLLKDRADINWANVFNLIASNEKGFPSVSTILKYIEDQVDVVDRAQLRIGKIFMAINKHGYYSQNEAYLNGDIDDIDWDIIKMHGGWKALAHSLENDTNLRAQMRMTAMAMLKEKENERRDNLVLLDGGKKRMLN